MNVNQTRSLVFLQSLSIRLLCLQDLTLTRAEMSQTEEVKTGAARTLEPNPREQRTRARLSFTRESKRSTKAGNQVGHSPDGRAAPSYVSFWDTLWLLPAARRTTGVFFLSILLISCGQPTQERVTLRYPHGWRFEPDEVSTRVTLT